MATIQEILADAIKSEQEAYAMYESAARQTGNALARSLLEALASDEREHERLLTGMSADEFIGQKVPDVTDLRITDTLNPIELSPNSSFQDILVFAAKEEDTAWKTYEALAQQAEDDETRQLFERLAEQEKGHKNRLEKLYDDVVYREN